MIHILPKEAISIKQVKLHEITSKKKDIHDLEKTLNSVFEATTH